MTRFIRDLKIQALFIGMMLFMGSAAQAEPFVLDSTHTRFGFSVKHLMVTDVSGYFAEFKGAIEYDLEQPDQAVMDITIQADSIETGVDQRDEHLRSSDFFNTDEFSEITFKATKIAKADINFVIVGDLTIKGVTKTVSIPSQIVGPFAHPFGGEVLAVTGEAVINRQDFGVMWNKTLDNGGLMVSDDVRLIINIEAKR